MTRSWDVHVDTHLAPWGGQPSDDCRWCHSARRAAALAEVRRDLAASRGDFGDEEPTVPDALPLAATAPVRR